MPGRIPTYGKKEKRNALRNKKRKKVMKRNGSKKSKNYIFVL
jgi:hypothetical protein